MTRTVLVMLDQLQRVASNTRRAQRCISRLALAIAATNPGLRLYTAQ